MKKSWERAPLDEAVFLQEGPGIRSYEYQKGGYPMINVRCVQDGYIDLSTCNAANVELATGKWKHFQVQEGDILFTISGSIGRTAIVKKQDLPLLMNTSVVRFRSKTPRLRDDFYFYYLQSEDFLGKLHALSSGTAQKNVGPTHLKTLDVPLPPLAEQQRIVGVLDKAFAGLAIAKANAEKNLENARALFESHLQSVFTQRGPGWMEKSLAELCERITKGSSPKWQGISYVDTPGILFVTSENVGEYDILLEQPKYVEEKFNAKDKKSILKNGDVLTNIVGASIGRTAVFNRDDGANINQAVCLIRCEPHLLNNYYLTYLLNSPVFKQVLHDNEVNNARANLSLGFFSQLPVPIPTIPKQKEIVAKLDAFREETQRLARIYERKLAALAELKKSLLHQAFNGEL